ncbi:GAF and ANTAR domain-containing protein [Amycolatopsis benzoatilytica]|uniref:GAF and ANTAR domain-containing protein n=1 Tax=Amycolatopsis benzoatilytica TaxID=346045 RepID=UPI00036DDFC8|nr:GAF and ANTAR domain-containing protein [Amycolatopsis benzoatilytica]
MTYRPSTVAAPRGEPLPLLRALIDMADTLADDYELVNSLHRLAESCVTLFSASAAGLMVADRRGALTAVVASEPGAHRLDLLQQHSGHGPSVDAHRLGAPIRVDNLKYASAKWPLFAAEALAEGFQSAYALPLQRRADAVGALTLLGRENTTLPPDELHEARALTEITAIGIVHEREIRECHRLSEQLQNALNTRVVIEQAKGVLAHAGQIPMQEAFAQLRHYCRRNQQQMTTIATMLATNALSPEEILGD